MQFLLYVTKSNQTELNILELKCDFACYVVISFLDIMAGCFSVLLSHDAARPVHILFQMGSVDVMFVCYLSLISV